MNVHFWHKADVQETKCRNNITSISESASSKYVWLARLKRVVFYLDVPLKRSALVITDTELRLIASAAIIGDNNCPVNG